MHDGFAADVRLARPRHILLTWRQRRANGMHAGYEETVAAQRVEHLAAHARHDLHVDHDVSRIGNLDTDLSDRAADRTHAEGNDVHSAAAHAARHETFQLRPHFIRRRPVVGRAGIVLRCRANEGAIFDPRDIGWMRPGEIGVGPLLRVQFGEGSRSDHFGAQTLIFLLRSVAPDDVVGLGQGGDLVHPFQQLGVTGPVFTIMSDCHR